MQKYCPTANKSVHIGIILVINDTIYILL